VDRSHLVAMALTPKYTPWIGTLEVLVLQIYFSGILILLRPIYFHSRKVKWLAIFSVILLVANVLVNLALIQLWSLRGAAVASVLLAALQTALYLGCEKEYFRYFRLEVLELAVVSLFLIVVMALAHLGFPSWQLLVLVTSGLALYTFLNRRYLRIWLTPDPMKTMRERLAGRAT
jgi:O-antigen/teichoic acid export membrane protein